MELRETEISALLDSINCCEFFADSVSAQKLQDVKKKLLLNCAQPSDLILLKWKLQAEISAAQYPSFTERHKLAVAILNKYIHNG